MVTGLPPRACCGWRMGTGLRCGGLRRAENLTRFVCAAGGCSCCGCCCCCLAAAVAVVIAALSMMMGVALPLMCTLYCSRDRRASDVGGAARYAPSSFFLPWMDRATERWRLMSE